jgi:ABC-2 type transport system ATP-binding protein
VTIIAAGRIVAEGRPQDLGGEARRRTVVRFRLPEGVEPDTIRGQLDESLAVSGSQATVETDHPQRTLYKLTGWAEGAGVELADLEVQRPTLEDVFLQLTGAQGGT